jgi:hypothetical protein
MHDANVQIEGRAVLERETQEGWKDDRRVREHHRDHEPMNTGCSIASYSKLAVAAPVGLAVLRHGF